jgi:hypothetical protein
MGKVGSMGVMPVGLGQIAKGHGPHSGQRQTQPTHLSKLLTHVYSANVKQVRCARLSPVAQEVNRLTCLRVVFDSILVQWRGETRM